MLQRLRRRLASLEPKVSYALGRKPPALVSIDVSGDCNLRCVMCSLEKSNPARGMMSLDAFARLVPQLDGIPVIELSSGCEPTLNRALPSMLRLLRERHPDAFLDLTTNATVLGDDVIASLIDSRVDKLMISLDAGERDAYEAIRVGAIFERVVANVRGLVRAKEEARSGRPALEVIFTWMTINAEQIFPLVDLLAELRIPSLIVNGLVPFDREAARYPMWGASREPEGVLQLARRATARGQERGVSLLFPEFQAREVTRCLDCNPVVSWNGDVFPCFMTSFERTFHVEGRHVPMPRVVLGNLASRTLPEIWSSPAAVAFRASKAMGQLPAFCRGCAMQMGVLCPSRSLA